ncbi:glycoside hydrolase [Ceraceosorus guamensis]|uniref:Glycoside hydrolase n=1 Tax=Ceraceosorus guamensis TaxID=1522189 RepID=A0A316W0I7_9BASI|nr:glycoside hydrolase [Ceraceosorus guamensis]PWN43300.1 glycoside hydrolase [Ceraceosorus guamensis]
MSRQDAVAGNSSLVNTWAPPLSTRGRYIVDANGKRFKLRGGNWHGASGTYLGRGDYNDPANHHAGELAYQTPLCLDRVALEEIVAQFLALGINTVRLPWSNEMLHTATIVPDSALRANPQLMGMYPLQIFDACVTALTRAGIAVILNNHTVKSIWCCGLDVNSRWNGAQTDQQWQADWVFLVQRYANNTRVIGAELYNEVRRDILLDPTWGGGGAADWWRASLDAANRIHREANADILIVIDGINYVGIPSPYTPHYRPELAPVQDLSHALAIPDKLVYAAHFYAYTGPNATGGNEPFDLNEPTYAELSPADLNATINRLASYVASSIDQVQKHYTAPVWISEFGIGRLGTSQTDKGWWGRFVSLLIDRDLEFAYWPLVGWQAAGVGDGYALLEWSSSGELLSIDSPGANDFRASSWNRLQQALGRFESAADATLSSSVNLTVPSVPRWLMLGTDRGSVQQSNVISGDIRYFPGDTKASCPDGLRLIGLTHQSKPRGLCTDAVFGRELWPSAKREWEVVTDERHVSHDWAKGYTKLECASGAFIVGYAFDDEGHSRSSYCAKTSVQSDPARTATAQGARTVWFDRHDAMGRSGVTQEQAQHGIFASDGGTAGSCADDELLAGYAFTTREHGGWPAALLCRNFNSSATPIGSADAAFASSRLYVGLDMFGVLIGGSIALVLTAWQCLRDAVMLV